MQSYCNDIKNLCLILCYVFGVLGCIIIAFAFTLPLFIFIFKIIVVGLSYVKIGFLAFLNDLRLS
jgi:hypothetical protein